MKHPIDEWKDDFWKSNTRNCLVNLFDQLVKLGLDDEDALDWCDYVFSSISGEYGN